jgi:hypothetical protein
MFFNKDVLCIFFQEVSLVKTLVEAGGFRRHEMIDVLAVVMPHKNDAAIMQIVNTVCADQKASSPRKNQIGDRYSTTRIVPQ